MKKMNRWELKVLLIMASVYIVAQSQAFLFPIFLAFLLYLLLNPVQNALIKFKIPRILASAIIVTVLAMVVSLGISFLVGPAYSWIEKAPEHFRTLENKLHIKRSLGKIYRVTESVQEMGTTPTAQLKVKVVSEASAIGASVFELTTSAMILLISIFVLLFFFLIYFKFFIQNLEKVIYHHIRFRKENPFILNLQNQVSRYMLAFTLICAGLGICMATALWLINFPNPLLWGAMVMFLTYIPYLGHLIGIITIFFISLVTFDNYWQMFAPSLIYLIFVTLEGQIVTPMLLGSRLNLNPLIVFLNMFFWGWIWGIAGVLISVPLLVAIKIILAYIPEWERYKILLEK